MENRNGHKIDLVHLCRTYTGIVIIQFSSCGFSPVPSKEPSVENSEESNNLL